eukprot:s3567_g2.t1
MYENVEDDDVEEDENDDVEDDNLEEEDEKDDNVAEDEVEEGDVADDVEDDDVKGEEDDDVENHDVDEEEDDDVADDDVKEKDRSQDWEQDFARASAVERHMDISGKPLYARIYSKHAADLYARIYSKHAADQDREPDFVRASAEGIRIRHGLLFAGGTVGAFDGMAFAGTCFAFGTEAVLGVDEEDAAAGLGGGCCGAYDFGVSMRGGALAAASAAALPILAAAVSPISPIAALTTVCSRLRATLVRR